MNKLQQNKNSTKQEWFLMLHLMCNEDAYVHVYGQNLDWECEHINSSWYESPNWALFCFNSPYLWLVHSC